MHTHTHLFAYLSAHLESENWTNCAPNNISQCRRHSVALIANPSIVLLWMMPCTQYPATILPLSPTVHTACHRCNIGQRVTISMAIAIYIVSGRQQRWRLFFSSSSHFFDRTHAINRGFFGETDTNIRRNTTSDAASWCALFKDTHIHKHT